MNGKSCFFIGHRETPDAVLPLLQEAVNRHIECYGVTEFVVGHYGNFDYLAAKAVIAAKQLHPEIILSLPIPYHPAERPIKKPKGFDNTYYPGSIAVTKRDGAGDPLKGAKFQLYKDAGTGGKTEVGSPVLTVPRIRQTIAEGDSGFDLKHMIFTDTDDKIYPVHTDGSGTQSYFYYRSLTGDEQNKYEEGTLTGYEEVAEFTNLLVNGTYYLKEAKVPDGYSAPQTDDDGYLIVGENGQTKITVPTQDSGNSVYHLLFTVTNHKNMILPTTGLSGIGRFLAAGVVLLTVAFILWKLKGIKGKSVSARARHRRRRRR